MTDGTKEEKIAHVIRIISAPPFMVSILLALLSWRRKDIFTSQIQVVWLVVTLGIIPVLAYPLQKILPSKTEESSRERERNLAFGLSVLGYTMAFLWSLMTQVSSQVRMICTTYFVSVILLVVCNRLLHVRASGHACSCTGPLLFLVYFVSWKVIVPCVLAATLIGWSSLTLKRHTMRDLLMGMIVCVISFAIAWTWMMYIG